jgi:hypothetical protein
MLETISITSQIEKRCIMLDSGAKGRRKRQTPRVMQMQTPVQCKDDWITSRKRYVDCDVDPYLAWEIRSPTL